MTAWTTVLWNISLSRGGVSPVPFGRPFATAAGAAAPAPFFGWAFGAGLAAGAFCVVPDSFAMVSALVDRFAAALADTELASVGERLDPAAHRFVAPAADDQHVGERQRAFALDDAALPQLLRRPLVLLHHVELLDEHPPVSRQHAQHLPALAPLPAGDHRHRVFVGLDQDHRIAVEADIRSVPPPDLFDRPHHDRTRHLALLHGAVRRRLLDGHDDRVSE